MQQGEALPTDAVFHVVLGRHEPSSLGGERIASAEFVVHPNYDRRTLDFDVALIRLTQASAQQPVSLYAGPPESEEAEFVGAVVTGWGLTDAFNWPDPLSDGCGYQSRPLDRLAGRPMPQHHAPFSIWCLSTGSYMRAVFGEFANNIDSLS